MKVLDRNNGAWSQYKLGLQVMTANMEEGNMAAEQRFVFGDRVLLHSSTGVRGEGGC